MELLILPIVILGILVCTLLNGATTPNGNLGVSLLLHALLCVATGANDEANEVVVGVLMLWDGDLFDKLSWLVISWWFEVGILLDQVLNDPVAEIQHLLLVPDLTGVQTHTILVIDRLRRGRSLPFRWDVKLIVLKLAINLLEIIMQSPQLRVLWRSLASDVGWKHNLKKDMVA